MQNVSNESIYKQLIEGSYVLQQQFKLLFIVIVEVVLLVF